MSHKVTIVTVSYNAYDTLRETIESVVEQTYPNIEYIMIDGASTDGTIDALKQYSTKIDYWESSKDRGIADAMNKGLARAHGEYVIFLHADDYLSDPNSIERIAACLHEDIVSAPIIKRDSVGEEHIVNPRGLNFWMNFKTGLFHQATLCSRELLLDLGGFNTTYNIAMDYDLFLRAYRCGASIRILGEPFSVMRDGGLSARRDARSLSMRLREERLIHTRNCPNAIMRNIYALYWHTYPYYKLGIGSKGVKSSTTDKIP